MPDKSYTLEKETILNTPTNSEIVLLCHNRILNEIADSEPFLFVSNYPAGYG